MKKFIAILAAVCLLLSLSACASQDELFGSVAGLEATPAPTEPPVPAGTDFDALFAAHSADETVMTVSGSPVSWGEFFYWCYSVASSLESYIGAVDYAEVSLFDESMSYGEYVVGEATRMALQYHSIAAGAAGEGLELTDEDKEIAAAARESDIVRLCGEGATEEDLAAYFEEMYMTLELYDFFTGVATLYQSGFNQLYGEKGEVLTDDEVMAFAEENGYMTAKHILISTVDAEGAALEDEAKAEKLAEAEDVVARLNAVEDEAERLELFDALMHEKSEDPGLASYPKGYCFTAPEMVAEFSAAAAALEENAISGIVETVNGYHILLRLPTTPADVVAYQSEEAQYDLRYVAASAAYDALTNGWLENAEVVWTPEFEGYEFGV